MYFGVMEFFGHRTVSKLEKLSAGRSEKCSLQPSRQLSAVSCDDSGVFIQYRVAIRELTYPTLGKGKSSSKVPLGGDILVPRRVPF